MASLSGGGIHQGERFGREDKDGIYWGRWAGGICELRLEEIVWDLSTFRLHTVEEMAKDRFGAYRLGSRVIPNKGDLSDYWVKISSSMDFLRGSPSYTYIRDPVRKLCHRLISYSISGRGQETEKVICTNLFNLRSMDQEAANVSYLLAHYLFRHAEGRKSHARLSGGHFIGRLAHHFGLAWVALGPERQPDVAAGAPRAVEDAPTVDEAGRLIRRSMRHFEGVTQRPSRGVPDAGLTVPALPQLPSSQIHDFYPLSFVSIFYTFIHIMITKTGSKFSTIVREYVMEPSTLSKSRAELRRESVYKSLEAGRKKFLYDVFQFMDTAYWSHDLAAKKSTMLVKYRSSGILYVL
ncbi:hypothetical protein Tco_1395335 [Tanacetum coccineum]